jgi:hypothetical protein
MDDNQQRHREGGVWFVGDLHFRRNVRRAVALRVLVVFYLRMSMPQGHFMRYPASRKIAVWMSLVVASLRACSPYGWGAICPKTAARAQEHQNANQRV